MKSITVTTLRSINFGAVLQAYALHKTQCKMDIDNILLDTPSSKNLYEKFSVSFSRRNIIVIIQNISYFIRQKSVKTMLKRFDNFIYSNFKLTKVYENFEMLLEEPPIADFYINGSDQVFGLRDIKDSIRMMDFLPECSKKYSYAASLGEYDWSEDEKGVFREKINLFKRVSVRERYAKDYLESFVDIECQTNIDPVFLLSKDEWDDVAVDIKLQEPYILCYLLIGNSEMQKVIKELKHATGYKVVCVQTLPLKRIKADKYIFDAGPAELLGLIRSASMVVTTSFHGTALSIIYEKPFYTLIKSYKSQRMTDLLEMLGLSDRIYRGQELNYCVDFLNARDIIAQEMKKSFKYLSEIIEECKINGEEYEIIGE